MFKIENIIETVERDKMISEFLSLHLNDIIVPFASAFAGAYFAYQFSVCSENKKENEEKFKQFNMLLNQINATWVALMSYKIVYLSKVENLLNKDPEKAVKQTIYPPNVLFKANIENNIFLAEYNFQLLPLLTEIEKQTFLIQEMINLCQSHFMSNRNEHILTKKEVEDGIDTFQSTKYYVDKSLSYLLLLREKLFKCKNLYFRYLYIDSRDIIMNHAYDNMVPNINSFDEIVGCSKLIEESWAKIPNIFDCARLFIDKIKFKISSLLKFLCLKK